MSGTNTSIEFPFLDNPRFENITRAPYELGHLLQQLPPDFSSYSEDATEETLLTADAAAQHANNAHDTLVWGLQALGNLMFVAGANDQNDIEKISLANLGCLIEYIGCEMQFLKEAKEDLTAAVRSHAERRMQTDTPKTSKSRTTTKGGV